MPALQAQDGASYDIYKTYTSLRTQPSTPLPPPLAAVSALVTALSHLAPQTVSETLSLLSTLAAQLKHRVRNPAILAAGTDVFQQYLVTALARTPQTAPDAFEATKAAIVRAGEAYVARGLEDAERAQRQGARWVRDGWSILVPAPSRSVEGVLAAAARQGTFFRVVLVVGPGREDAHRGLEEALAKLDTPVARIGPNGVADALARMPRSDVRGLAGAEDKVVVLSGAGSVLASGGVVAALGTLQAACVAQALGREFWVVAEGSRCARWDGDDGHGAGVVEFGGEEKQGRGESGLWEDGYMDVTPPEMITGFITERGPQVPAALAEEAIRIWF